MIQTVFFDFDGVLTTDKTGSYTTCKNIQKNIPDVPLDRITECYRKNRHELLLGLTTHAAIWADFCKCVGRNLDIKILEQAFKNTPMNTEMMELCKNLKKNYKLGIITDNSKERFELLKQEMNLLDIFDYLILSADIGSMKDSPEIFQKALNAAHTKPQECVFIDNDEKNLIIPEELGFHTFFYDNEKNQVKALANELKELGMAF